MCYIFSALFNHHLVRLRALILVIFCHCPGLWSQSLQLFFVAPPVWLPPPGTRSIPKRTSLASPKRCRSIQSVGFLLTSQSSCRTKQPKQSKTAQAAPTTAIPPPAVNRYRLPTGYCATLQKQLRTKDRRWAAQNSVLRDKRTPLITIFTLAPGAPCC